MQGHLVLWMRSKGVCLTLGWMPSRVSWAWLPASALGALGLSSGPESEPWAAGIPQAPELPSGQLWDLESGSRLPLMAFL